MREVPYEDLARRAAEHVKGLDEPLKSVAFQTFLKDMIDHARSGDPAARALIVESKHKEKSAPTDAKGDSVQAFLNNVVDASTYSSLFEGRGHLTEKSLAVLKLAKDQLGVDGLTAAEIAQILILKFRVAGVQAGHVSRDLRNPAGLVQIVGSGRKRRFLLMAAGERHLDGFTSGLTNQ